MDLKAWYIRKNWTTDEVERLRILAGEKVLCEIAALMGRSENSIRGASQRFGIPVKGNSTDEKRISIDEQIRQLYKTMPIREICCRMGLSYSRVYRIVTKNPG